MKLIIACVLALIAAVSVSADHTTCPTGGLNCANTYCPANDNCTNCVYTCSCTKNGPPSCPPPELNGFCGTVPGRDNGCGGTTSSTNCSGNCLSSQVCVDGTCKTPCPTTCKTTVTSNNGTSYTLDGVCATTQPNNTIPGGPCPDNCGTCYVDSFNPALCDAGVNGSPCSGGKCGCFATAQGGSCKATNFLSPKPSPLPSNGGGCQENVCNAVASKSGISAACCPSGCTKRAMLL